MTGEEFGLVRDMSSNMEDLAARMNALDWVVFAITREMEDRMPGFRHAALERVSAALATMPAASGKGLEVRQRSMQHADDMLRK